MKKNRLIICLTFMSCPFLMGQSLDHKLINPKQELLDTLKTNKKITYVYPKVNHWSIAGHAGISFLDGDQSQDYNTLWPRSGADLAFGVNVEYTFTPGFGLYAEYLYNP